MSRLRSTSIHFKLERALVQINELERRMDAFADLKPYTVKVVRDTQGGGAEVGRFVALKNRSVGPPSAAMALLAGEILYQLRSSLDHTIHDLIVNNKKRSKISRRTQFPIFDTSGAYLQKAPLMIAGVSKAAATIIERAQPFTRTPHAPKQDPLWILQDLNNTDKHRFVSATVMGLHGVDISDRRGRIGRLDSPDVVLKHGKVFWSFTLPDKRYSEIKADLRVAVAFKDAMEINGATVPMSAMLSHIASRVYEIVGDLGLTKPTRNRMQLASRKI